MAKISFVGGGMIGQMLAQLVSIKNLASEVVLIDINKAKVQGSAMDILQSSPAEGADVPCHATDDYSAIANSDVIVITAGVTGVSSNDANAKEWNRDAILESNVKIISSVAKEVKKYAPQAFVMVITNPLDVIVKVFKDISGLPADKVVGETGTDDNRLRYFCAQHTKASVKDVTGFVVGEHGDSMVPLFSTVTIAGIPVAFSKKEQEEIKESVVMGAKRVIDQAGISPYRTVATAAITTIESYLQNRSRLLSISTYDEEKDLYYSYPSIVNSAGAKRYTEAYKYFSNEERSDLDAAIVKIKLANEKASKLLNS